MKSLTTDNFFNGQIQVKQYRSGYRFSIDAVLLAHLARPQPVDRIIDLGTGCGIIPLLLAYRHPGVTLFGIEVQKPLSEIAGRNVDENQMSDRVTIICQDLKSLKPDMVSGPADLVVSNPPYRKIESGRINPDRQRAIARHEIKVSVQDVVQSAGRVLRNSGRLVMIFPAARMVDLMVQMRSSSIEPKYLQVIYSREAVAATRVVIEGIKGGRPGLKVAPALTIYRKDGSYTTTVSKMFAP